MRPALPAAITAALLIAGCGSKADHQADALDNAANQADPAAADVMRNEADAIRENGSDANLSAPGSPVQDAMANAGQAAENAPVPSDQSRKSGTTPNTQAAPHHAGDQVPPPQTR